MYPHLPPQYPHYCPLPLSEGINPYSILEDVMTCPNEDIRKYYFDIIQEPLSYRPITRLNAKKAAVYEVQCVL